MEHERQERLILDYKKKQDDHEIRIKEIEIEKETKSAIINRALPWGAIFISLGTFIKGFFK
jgi:hypothetical protein